MSLEQKPGRLTMAIGAIACIVSALADVTEVSQESQASHGHPAARMSTPTSIKLSRKRQAAVPLRFQLSGQLPQLRIGVRSWPRVSWAGGCASADAASRFHFRVGRMRMRWQKRKAVVLSGCKQSRPFRRAKRDSGQFTPQAAPLRVPFGDPFLWTVLRADPRRTHTR